MKFKLGDVCEIVAPDAPEFHGRECTVIALAEWMDDVYDVVSGGHLAPGLFYTIDVAGDDGFAFAMESELRLKRPPAWDEWIGDTSQVEHEQQQPVLA